MSAAAKEPASIARRSVVAAVAGNALEFYDFTAYTFFAIQIGQTFFPSKNAFLSLMLSLGTFGAGFLGRPIGGIVIGAFADRRGRRPAMVLSFVLMGAGILALALTPSYAAIGITAPLIVIASRIVQGFALGGQVGPATAYLLEASAPATRGFYTTLQYASQGLAALIGGGVAFALASWLDAAQLASFGWRIAFLLGAVVLPFGFLMQRALPETLAVEALPRERLGDHIRIAVLGLVMLGSSTIAVYTMYYLPTYAQTALHMKASVASAAGMVFGAGTLVFSVVSGLLSDRIGRKPVMIWPRVLLTLAIMPLFIWLMANPSGAVLLTVTAIVASLATLNSAAGLVAIAEALPAGMRSGVLGTIYAVAIAGFGGTAQLIEAWLTKLTGSALAPAWYLTAATAIGLVAMILMDETAPVKRGGS